MLLRSSSKVTEKQVNPINETTENKIQKKKKLEKKVLNKSEIATIEKELLKDKKESVKLLDIGDGIPDLNLSNQDGNIISLKEITKLNKIVVIFAYPRASTPGCTRQVCAFRDNFNDLKKYAWIMGISSDKVTSQLKFHDKQNLPFDLLSDPEKKFIEPLGAKKHSASNGGGIIRSYWIFVDGKLKFKKVKVSPEDSVIESKKHIIELAEYFTDI